MICPRCGVTNAADRAACSRCSGKLVPTAAGQPQPPAALIPITRRAELAAGRAGVARAGTGTIGGEQAAAGDPAGLGELYLLASDRPTGQPAPPEAAPGTAGPVRGERPGRVAVGLSGA